MGPYILLAILYSFQAVQMNTSDCLSRHPYMLSAYKQLNYILQTFDLTCLIQSYLIPNSIKDTSQMTLEVNINKAKRYKNKMTGIERWKSLYTGKK